MYDFPAMNLCSREVEKGDHNIALGFPLEPWVGYDPKCRAWVSWKGGDPESVAGGFFPMPPLHGPASLKLAKIEKQLAEVEQQLAEGTLIPRAKFHMILDKHRFRSWIAQLRDEPGAIPVAAGDEYRQWVGWLRAHDPDLGGDPHYEITAEDHQRTLDAVDRAYAAEAAEDQARQDALVASGVWHGNYPGKQNDPKRLPR